ncbi:NADP-dependent oxidoreductase [Paractinoplanes ferrugineus]|uniref:NADPH:quinone reductase n=1 Tax=Paractinoplanes ferrugineus TaxID=113564 RepID=A0A919J4N5_9ACTN|nr:NADP-dependent oxidoreductase [Actinoplanes ferrugineus]GIE13835.1 NADPH:quinone reductase [Actinoplanes ferrugineus]
MRALRAHHRGGPEQLVLEDVPVPVPGADEVLVEVHAAAITLAELTWEETWQTRDGVDRTPTIPSHEVSGVVAAVGDQVTALAAGDEVYGLVDFDRNGAAAEFVTVPASALAAKPARISHVEAAALPLAALTAWQALVDHAELQKGERVLVHGGAGGVGVYGVQIAAALGAHVIATELPGNEALVRDLGAAEFLDFTTQRFDEELSGLDVVLDAVGGDTLARSYAVLRPGGRLVTLSAPPDQAEADRYRLQAVFFIVRPDHDELTHIATSVDDGILRPIVSEVFPLAEGRTAFEHGRGPRRPGKIILAVRPDSTPR